MAGDWYKQQHFTDAFLSCLPECVVLNDLNWALRKVDFLQVWHVEFLEDIPPDERKVVSPQVQDLGVWMKGRDFLGQRGVDTLHCLLSTFPLADADVWARRPASYRHEAQPQEHSEQSHVFRPSLFLVQFIGCARNLSLAAVASQQASSNVYFMMAPHQKPGLLSCQHLYDIVHTWKCKK